MPQYYSTFPSGFEPAIEEFMARDMPGTQVLRVLDGAVEYKRRSKLMEFPRWFNNTFLCLTTFPRAPKDPLQDMVRLALQRGIDSEVIFSHLPAGASTFRAMFMLEGELAHAGMKTMAKAEGLLCQSSGLKPGRARPDVEFWFLYRREGMGFLLMRLTQHRDYAKQLEAGELRPDVASILCKLSHPKPGDIFLDPFAGHGGIVKARLFDPAAEVIAGDINPPPGLYAAIKNALNARIIKMDALKMQGIPSGSVDTIVCDPPWGLHAPLSDPPAFYGMFASEARRVLKKGGRLVLLTSLKKEAESALGLCLTVQGRMDVLISGRKTAVFICRN
jgi:hypothetical protein